MIRGERLLRVGERPVGVVSRKYHHSLMHRAGRNGTDKMTLDKKDRSEKERGANGKFNRERETIEAQALKNKEEIVNKCNKYHSGYWQNKLLEADLDKIKQLCNVRVKTDIDIVLEGKVICDADIDYICARAKEVVDGQINEEKRQLAEKHERRGIPYSFYKHAVQRAEDFGLKLISDTKRDVVEMKKDQARLALERAKRTRHNVCEIICAIIIAFSLLRLALFFKVLEIIWASVVAPLLVWFIIRKLKTSG